MTTTAEGYTTRDGFYLARSLAFPDARHFHDVFTDYELEELPKKEDASRYVIPMWRFEKEISSIGRFVSTTSVPGFKHFLYATPSPDTLKWIMSNMLCIDGDTITFTMVEHPERQRALVIATYSSIIGSRWLAYIDSTTIPRKAPP